MSATNNISAAKIVTVSFIVLIAGLLLHSYINQKKTSPSDDHFFKPDSSTLAPKLTSNTTSEEVSVSLPHNDISSHLIVHDEVSGEDVKYNFPFHFYPICTSTMDKAKELAISNGNDKVFGVLADFQTKGRGTQGRAWLGGRKNMLLTVVVKKSLLPIPFNTLPLRIGTIIASAVQARVTSGAAMTLKWPNDVLLDGKKTSGILIESDGDNYIVGIGCNVMQAPEVVSSGPNGGRPATCLAHHNAEIGQFADELAAKEVAHKTEEVPTASINEVFDDSEGVMKLKRGDYHKLLALDICTKISAWIDEQNDSTERVLSDFEQVMDRSVQKLRDANNHASPEGEQVQPLGVDKFGGLMVRSLNSGEERVLRAEYLW